VGVPADVSDNSINNGDRSEGRWGVPLVCAVCAPTTQAEEGGAGGNGVIVLSHCVYTVVTLLFHGYSCYTVLTMLLHSCYIVLPMFFQCCYTVVTLLLHS
jgi:hypothetical protein